MLAYGKIEPKEIKDIIDSKDRTRAGKTLPAHRIVFSRSIL